jgi:hypothetical protein
MKWLLLLIAVEISLAVDSSFLTRNIGSLGTFGGTYCDVFPTTITDELVEIQFYGGSYLDALALRYKTQSGTYYTTSRCCGTGGTQALRNSNSILLMFSNVWCYRVHNINLQRLWCHYGFFKSNYKLEISNGWY